METNGENNQESVVQPPNKEKRVLSQADINDNKKRKQYLILPLFFIVTAIVLFVILGGGKNTNSTSLSGRDSTSSSLISLFPDAKKGSIANSKLEENYEGKEYTKKQDLDFKFLAGQEEDSTVNRSEKNVASFTDLQHKKNARSEDAGVRTLSSQPQETPSMARLRQIRKQPLPSSRASDTEDANSRYNRSASYNRNSSGGYRTYPDPYSADYDENNRNDVKNRFSKAVANEAKYEAKLEILQSKYERQQKALDSIKAAHENGRVSAYRGKVVSTLGNSKSRMNNNFYGSGSDGVQPGNEIQAVIHDAGTIMNGNTVKLRLTQDAVINDTRIPAGSFVYALANLESERLNLTVTSVQHNGRIYMTSLVAYDMDGIKGVHVPGAALQRQVDQSGAQIINSTRAGGRSQVIRGVQNIFSKRVRQEKASVTANYLIILKPSKG